MYHVPCVPYNVTSEAAAVKASLHRGRVALQSANGEHRWSASDAGVLARCVNVDSASPLAVPR